MGRVSFCSKVTAVCNNHGTAMKKMEEPLRKEATTAPEEKELFCSTPIWGSSKKYEATTPIKIYCISSPIGIKSRSKIGDPAICYPWKTGYP
mmetsp:Transcript_9463/g.19596  ORF Transcript_9463/g.19596 Transcript_9463/m.19596 type:complete len:92 (+) Transcript_9463:334-609(+)